MPTAGKIKYIIIPAAKIVHKTSEDTVYARIFFKPISAKANTNSKFGSIIRISHKRKKKKDIKQACNMNATDMDLFLSGVKDA